MIKYIGSKRTLVPTIVEVVSAFPGTRTVCDLFTGTTRVAQGLKAAGMHVVANDLASYSEVLARCYIECDAREVDLARIGSLVDRLNALPGVDGYVTETFCRQARYFQPHNGRRIDAIRDAIDDVARDDIERAVLLTSLLEAADRVDSTTGLQMAYLKQWAPRSYNDLELRVPALLAGPGEALRHDANELAPRLDGIDVVYVDPPYNQHSYHSNYHVWETIVRNDRPETYGIACKRLDCRTVKSDYNFRRRAWQSFERLVLDLPAPCLVVSFNNEGFHDVGDLESLLAGRGHVESAAVDFKRYVGAQIGIHSPSGQRVGEVSHVRNREHLFVVAPTAAAARAAIEPARRRAAAGGRGSATASLRG